ncbi:MAG: C-GCAxxG-C-C family protein [Bacillota bacterium]
MDRSEEAQAIFKEGFNCAQTVLAVFAPDLGLDKEAALRVAGALGGGIGRMGETCGAVMGALMALGLKYGMTRPGDLETKEYAYEQAGIFIEKFKECHGQLKCRALLGYDVSIPAEAELIKAKDLHNTLCTGYIRDAIALLEEMLNR